MADNTRITSTKIDIDEKSIQRLYAERAVSRAEVDVDAPVVLASDTDPNHIREWNEYEVEHWLPYMQLDENAHVLELGFGTGRMAKYIIEKAGSYTGIDYVSEFVDTVKNRKDIKAGHGIEPVFMEGSFQDLCDKKLSLPREKYNRFVISGGVLVYINDKEVEEGLKKLPDLLTDDAIIYISEPIALAERLTLNRFFSESMGTQYSAIYRNEAEYKKLFAPFFEKGFSLKVSQEFFEEDIKGQKETRQWIFVMGKED